MGIQSVPFTESEISELLVSIVVSNQRFKHDSGFIRHQLNLYLVRRYFPNPEI